MHLASGARYAGGMSAKARKNQRRIATMNEKPLHAALKRWYAEDGDRIEEPVDGFVIDIVRDKQLIEIQTRSFSSMKRKLNKLISFS